jgi:hypothetical protein
VCVRARVCVCVCIYIGGEATNPGPGEYDAYHRRCPIPATGSALGTFSLADRAEGRLLAMPTNSPKDGRARPQQRDAYADIETSESSQAVRGGVPEDVACGEGGGAGGGGGARRGRGGEQEGVHIMLSHPLKEAGVFRMCTYTECLNVYTPPVHELTMGYYS